MLPYQLIIVSLTQLALLNWQCAAQHSNKYLKFMLLHHHFIYAKFEELNVVNSKKV